MICSGRRPLFQEPDQARPVDFVHFPDEFEEVPGDGRVVTAFDVTDALFAAGHCDLSFGREPEVHPERQVDKDDRVGPRQATLDAGPGAPAVDDPIVPGRDLVELFGHEVLLSLHPAREPLDAIDRDIGQCVTFGQTKGER